MNKLYFFLLGNIIGLLLTSCGKQEQNAQQPPASVPVNIYQVSRQAVTGKDSYPGTVVPLKEVEIRAQVAGYITNIFVQDGQKVAEGQKLYEIDRSKYQAAYSQAQANLSSAIANREKAKQDLTRYENLLDRDAIARQVVDHARAEYESAQAQVNVAQAQVKSAATDLGYSLITAPFTGTIGISQVRVGSQVSPGQTLLNTLSSDHPIGVNFVINETEIPRFSILMQSAPDSTFTIQLPDGSKYPFTGKLTAIDRAVDRQTGSIDVRLTFPNPDRVLIGGMTINVQVLNQDIGKQIVIPEKAAMEQMGEFFVYVVSGDSVIQRKIELGTRINGKVIIREGLEEGEKIVVEGIQRLRPGSKIAVDTVRTQTLQK